ncbi:hypothetical protein F8B43_1855 [Methylorubrum populi]|uniref:Uncharacterized protein n=1 Tax=Methylorubrum populi TaxID=223967 RepID=A0A833N367_9HYPH|nr:hypothetical protein F8B43_1855 [Methylorubrum populi]
MKQGPGIRPAKAWGPRRECFAKPRLHRGARKKAADDRWF